MVPEEIKSRLRSGNACYHSVQNLLSSRLLSKNLNTQFIIWCIFRIKLSFSTICWRLAVLEQFRLTKVSFRNYTECKVNAFAIYCQILVLMLSTIIFDSIFRDILRFVNCFDQNFQFLLQEKFQM